MRYNTGGRKDYLINVIISGEEECCCEDGVMYTYNGVGMPIKYRGKYLSWELNRLTGYGSNTYTYDAGGQRKSKNEINYEYAEGNLVRETRENEVIVYYYGTSGIVGFRYNYDEYYYQKNLQGDVTKIYKFDYGTNSLTLAARYEYDAYGNHKVQDANGNENKNADFIGNINPIRYRSYYYDVETGLYYLQTRYYDPEFGRFISPDSTKYLDPTTINGLNLYSYCLNNPVMYIDDSGNMPKWAQWIVGGLAIAGLVVATVLTLGVAGAGAAAVGAAMLTGGMISAGINVIDQLHDGGTFDWTELAISTLSGAAYGLVVGLTGGAAGTWSWSAFSGKLAVAGGTSLLNSWNDEKNLKDTIISFGTSLLLSSIYQGIGYGFGKLMSLLPKDPTKIMTLGDIASCLWGIPAVKTGVIRFVGGIAGAIFNDF